MVEVIPGVALLDHIMDRYKEILLESVLKTLHITFKKENRVYKTLESSLLSANVYEHLAFKNNIFTHQPQLLIEF